MFMELTERMVKNGLSQSRMPRLTFLMSMKLLSKKLNSPSSAQDNTALSSIQLEKTERINGESKNSERENKASSFSQEKLLKRVFKTLMY